ncbi:hypothetical protein GN956_G23903 [Arapaima gigas]
MFADILCDFSVLPYLRRHFESVFYSQLRRRKKVSHKKPLGPLQAATPGRREANGAFGEGFLLWRKTSIPRAALALSGLQALTSRHFWSLSLQTPGKTSVAAPRLQSCSSSRNRIA